MIVFNFYIICNTSKAIVAGFNHGSEAEEYADTLRARFEGRMKYTVLARHLAEAVVAARDGQPARTL
jgi:hypothetical protein